MSDQPALPEEETTILVGGMTREEFLGQPERVWFAQPKRSISKHSPRHSVEKGEGE